MLISPLTPSSLAPFWTRFRRHVIRTMPKDASHLGRLSVPKIGLCVSGGPDSMALAYLVSKYLTYRPNSPGLKNLYGIVVDHDARPGSRAEAQMVAGWLDNLGIQASVEKMDWEKDDPSQLTDFELEARVRRYRHLGAHATEKRIRHLFTGHHKDDQVETLLMRLIRGNNTSLLGLCGMQETSPIPECGQYRGMRNEEPSRPITSILREVSFTTGQDRRHTDAFVENRLGQVLRTGEDWVRGLLEGGIEIHRPLLEFSKRELIATCDSKKIPYIIDKTNRDPTFTRRNAIRVMRQARLPRALQPASLIRLGEAARNTKADIQDRALAFLRHVSILAFDFRSGTADIRLPLDFAELASLDRNAAAVVVAQLASLVSPVAFDFLPTLAPSEIVQSFTWASQKPHELGRARPPVIYYNKVLFAGIPYTDVTSTIWRLSRAPMTAKDFDDSVRSLESRQRYWPNPRRNDPFAQSHITDLAYHEELNVHAQGWSRWKLWDQRFWIRARVERTNLLPQVNVRAYTRPDLQVLKSRMPEVDFDQLIEVLHQSAPGKTRYTLPVLTFMDEVIAFPTLFRTIINKAGYYAKLAELGLWARPGIFFEVAYKLLPKSVGEWGSKVAFTHMPAAQHSGQYDALRHVPDPEKLRLHRVIARYRDLYGPLDKSEHSSAATPQAAAMQGGKQTTAPEGLFHRLQKG